LEQREGKLTFDDGMLKLSLNNKDVAMDNCKYTVTSGTVDLATFSAGCKLNATAMSNAPVKPMDNALDKTSNETKDVTPSAQSSNVHPDDAWAPVLNRICAVQTQLSQI